MLYIGETSLFHPQIMYAVFLVFIIKIQVLWNGCVYNF